MLVACSAFANFIIEKAASAHLLSLERRDS